jgi:hypothetical protein
MSQRNDNNSLYYVEPLVIINTSNATGITTGACIIYGGLSASGNTYIGGNAVVSGGLTAGSFNVNNLQATNITTTNLRAGSATLGSLNVTGASTLSGNLTVNGPGLRIPTGNIATRPVVPEAGHVRYNTETSQFEGYGPGSAWGSLGGVVDIAQTTKILASASPSTTDGNLYFYTVGSERMRVNSAGNVGIGTSNASYKLDIAGTLRATGGDITVGTLNLTSTNIALGANSASMSAQGTDGIAIGNNAGLSGQLDFAIAIGSNAGVDTQQANTVAIGNQAGYEGQNASSVAIGYHAGNLYQGGDSIAMGTSAGNYYQQGLAIAVGSAAGSYWQGYQSIAMGNGAGNNWQGNSAVAVGTNAGNTSQGSYTVAMGSGAGQTSQGEGAVAMGLNSGNNSQGNNAVAIGLGAGNTFQGNNALAMGVNAGQINQGLLAIALGADAGNTSQGEGAVAVGTNAGGSSQGTESVAVGTNAGSTSQGVNAVAMGYIAGQTSQGDAAVAIGSDAGQTSQGSGAVALGVHAGNSMQGGDAVAVGAYAGNISQGSEAVAVGNNAGQTSQGIGSIALGINAGNTFQGASAVALGANAGNTSQGSNAVAIGNLAGQTSQHTNSIILNANSTALNSGTAGAFYVSSVRNVTQANLLAYDTTSKEVSYFSLSNITTSNLVATNISTSTLIATRGSFGTVSSTLISGTTYTGANMSLSGNLNVGGTLTVVNITSTNLVETNITAGSILATTLRASTGITTGSIHVSADSAGIHFFGGGRIFKQGDDGIHIIPSTDGNPADGIGGIKFKNAANNSTTMQVFGNGTLNVTTSVSSASLFGANSSITNLRTTTLTSGAMVITGGSLNATFNSNTVGSIFTTGGNVGVGTVTPSAKLSVNGNINATGEIVASGDGTGITFHIGRIYKQGGAGLRIVSGAADTVFTNYTNNFTTMSIADDGILSVTTRVSSANMAAGSITSGAMVITGGSLNATFNSNIVGNIFTTGGNVGIGQGNPSTALSIFNGGMNVGGVNSIITQGAHIQWNRSAGEGESWIINQKGMGGVNSGIRFGTSNTTNNVTEWMRIIENGNVGINNTSPTYKLDITGTLRATGGDITTATLLATTSISSASIQGTNSTITNAVHTTLTSGTLRVNTVNMTPSVGDIASELTFAAGNGVTSASNITGLSFSNAIVRGFNALLTSTVVRTTGGNLYANYELKGIQQANGWILNSSFMGDNTGVTFSINTAGNVQYTSTSLGNFTSNTLKFKASTTSI